MLLVDELGVAIKACEGLGMIPYSVSLSKVLAESVNGKRPERVREVTGLKVIAFEGNCVRLSLRTYIPKLEDLFSPKKVGDATEPSEVNHELLIELLGTMGLKNVEIFPNDVYINDILDAAKALRIVLCTMRRLVVKNANKSRRSLEYLDKDETVVAHVVGGVDAFIKVPQGWPLSSSPLNSDQQSKGISLSFLCKVQISVHLLISY
ncbi:hypothetical protein CerSpe_017070 [Prunus speciosa]